MKNKHLSVLFALSLLIGRAAHAQNFDEIRKQFPDEKAVMLNRSFEYNISLKNDAPYVESSELQQIAYLTPNATAYMGEYGFSHSDFQELISYEAYTRTPTDKKLKVSEFKTNTDKEGFVFYDDVKETKFNFPAVEPGATGNLQVSWHNKDPHLLGSFYFSGYMPSINSALKITVAKNISIKYLKTGLDTANIAVSVESKHGNNIYTFIYKNCPADKHYGDAPGFAWYSPHVVFYIDSYKDGKGNTVSYLANTDDLYKLSYSYIKDVNTKVNPELKHLVDSLTTKLSTPEAKARSIYAWVQGNIKYVAFEDGMGGFVPRDAGLVCSRRFGDCKDMASILTEMLNVAGVPAYFTWLGTRDLPYKFTELPLPMDSNHMICTAMLNGKFVFLDGTDPTCVFGTTPAGIQGKQVMIGISDKEYKIETIPVMDAGTNLIADTTRITLEPDGIKGQITRNLKGYYATGMYGSMMFWLQKDIKEIMKNEFERGSNRFLLDTFRIEKKPIRNEITLYGTFSLPGYAKKIGDEYYLNLSLFKFFEDERVDYPKRKAPMEFNFKSQRKYVTILTIPAGYKVSYLPPGKSFHNKLWGFDFKYEQKGNQVILTQELDNNNLLVTCNDFEQWNAVLDNMHPFYKETLSLLKL